MVLMDMNFREHIWGAFEHARNPDGVRGKRSEELLFAGAGYWEWTLLGHMAI
jgi:hypothetical protein